MGEVLPFNRNDQSKVKHKVDILIYDAEGLIKSKDTHYYTSLHEASAFFDRLAATIADAFSFRGLLIDVSDSELTVTHALSSIVVYRATLTKALNEVTRNER